MFAVAAPSVTAARRSPPGGAEYAFHQNWSVKGEYLYVDLGDAGMGTRSVNFKTSVARFGLNYRFPAAL